jgi:hypothetical protein
MRTAGDQEPTMLLKNHVARLIVATDHMVSSTKDWQTIREYLVNRVNEIKLSPAQQAKLERYQFMYNQLVSGKYTDAEVMSASIKMFDIKQTQVYEDLSCTRELFNSVINVNKRFELSIQLQINRNMLRKAEELCDFKAYASLEKNRALMLSQIEEIADNAGEMFTGHEIEPMFDPSLLGISGAEDIDMQAVLKDINSKRKAKIKTEMFTDIPHEEL